MVPFWLVCCVCIQNVMHILMRQELMCSRDKCTGYQVTKKMINCVMRLLGTIRYILGTLFQYSKNYDNESHWTWKFLDTQLCLLYIGFKIVNFLYHLRCVALLVKKRGLLCLLFIIQGNNFQYAIK